MDHPTMKGFVGLLDQINAVADQSPGFVWRLQTEDGDATALRLFDDELILVNMSVWKSIKSLHEYVYRSEHLIPFKDRRRWFDAAPDPNMALWWIPADHMPSMGEGRDHLHQLGRLGPTARAFTFARAYTPAGESHRGHDAAP